MSSAVASRLQRQRLKLRSRKGCTRCRTRRQKCDETRPECSRCFRTDAACIYDDARRSRRQISPVLESVARSAIAQASAIGQAVPLRQSSLSDIDPFDTKLLVYFIREASGAISCHESLQLDTCQALVSTGSDVPCLWYSILLFSALHWTNSERTIASVPDKLEVRILSLRSKALTALREATRSNNAVDRDAILATAMMLTMSEIHFEPEAGAWRAHWIWMKRTQDLYYPLGHSTSQHAALSRFVHRRFSVVDFLASLPMSTYFAGHLLRAPTLPVMDGVGLIDGTLACSVDLVGVFHCIGALHNQRTRATTEARDGSARGMARSLLVLVEAMLARDQSNLPELSEDVRSAITQSQVIEYCLCNQAAQNMALICIRRHLLDLEQQSDCVQESVREIVRIARTTSGHPAVSPAVNLVTGLFIAGCHAEPPEQVEIIDLLNLLHSKTGSRNTRRTIKVLEGIWADIARPGDTEMSPSSRTHALDIVEFMLTAAPALVPVDFLPY